MKPCKDHSGNKYPSEQRMCKYYGINEILAIAKTEQ